MKKSKTDIYFILIRYLILLLVVLFGLPIIYKIFTPLTTKFSAKLLGLFYNISSNRGLIVINETTSIYIVDACVAGSAYLLLIILNLLTPLEKKKRVYSLIYSICLLFIVNIFRIVALSALYHNKIPYADFTHVIFWYGLSTVFVILIWFETVRAFKIRSIPFYTDYKSLISGISSNK